MDNIVSGLFGLSPRDVRLQQQGQLDAYSQALASYAPKGFELASLLGGQAGAGITDIGAEMMGMVNPEVEAAKRREAALGQVDFNTPEGILAAAKAAGERGDVKMQLQLQMLARQRMAETKKEDSPFAKIDPKDYTSESLKVFAQTKDPTDLIAKTEAPKAPPSRTRISGGIQIQEELQSDGTWKEVGRGERFAKQITGIGGGGESKQPLPYIDPTTGKAVWGTIAEARGKPAAAFDPVTKQIVASAVAEGTVKGKDVAMIGGKYDALDAISSAQGLLEKGIYTGGYASAGKAIAKYTPGMDKTKVANTEEFLSHIGNVVIPRLQEFGGNDSVEELKYLRAVSAGDITLEKEAIKKILSAAERKINAGIRRVAKGRQQTSGGGLSIEDRLNKYK